MHRASARRSFGCLAALVALAVLAAIVTAASALAAYPGKPGPIAFVQQTVDEGGGEGGIFAHPPVRSRRGAFLTSSIYDSSPSYSADGRRIVFSGNREAVPGVGAHLYLMNADGSGVTQLTEGEGFDSNPCFSPDGRQVVFDRRAGASHEPHIFVVNVDGSGLRQLTSDTSADYEPVFSPNGRWIAFVSDRDPDVRSDRSDIFAMRADGSRQKVLIDGPHNEFEPDISPNGRRIAFASNARFGVNIWVARASGHQAHQLTFGRRHNTSSRAYVGPAWAPDGRHIAFLSGTRYGDEVEVMRPDGTHVLEFASGGTEEEGYGTTLGPPTWGPQSH